MCTVAAPVMHFVIADAHATSQLDICMINKYLVLHDLNTVDCVCRLLSSQCLPDF